MKRVSWFFALIAMFTISAQISGQDYGEHCVSPVSSLESNVDAVNVALGGGKDCGSCGKSACACRSGGWYAGVEATYLLMEPNESLINFDEGDPRGNLNDDSEFDYGFEAAPRIWLGYEGRNGWGIRGRYWQFDTEASVASIEILDGNEIDAQFASSNIEAYTVDMEVTRRFQRGCWDLLGSVGARHASISHQYLGQQMDIDDGDVDDADMMAFGRRMDGTGVTVALEGARGIGNRNLSMFWSLRGSAIFGDNKASAVGIDIDDDAGNVDADSSRESDDLFIFDAQVGLEWSQPVECIDSLVFIRGAFEYQLWDLNEVAPLDVQTGENYTRIDSLGRGDVGAYGIGISAGILR